MCNNKNIIEPTIISSLSEIKIDLIELFNMYGIKEAPKASFLERFFELKKVLITNKVTGKRDSAYEILKLRDF